MASINGINSGIDYSVFFGGSSTSSADNQIKKLDKEIKEAENRLKYL